MNFLGRFLHRQQLKGERERERERDCEVSAFHGVLEELFIGRLMIEREKVVLGHM